MRRLLPTILLPVLLLSPGAAPAHPNARFYRGEIRVSTTWEGVIRLTGTVTIREGVTVSVDPGTQVLVQPEPQVEIRVRGRLLVRGTKESPVLFDTAGGCGEGPWGSILFLPGSTGILEHARIVCSSGGIRGALDGVVRTGVLLEPGR
ncbi:MAG: hypothetical protein Kow00128_16550 [Deltaproteobacteria bacterium]